MTFLSAPLTAPPCGPETTCLRRLSAAGRPQPRRAGRMMPDGTLPEAPTRAPPRAPAPPRPGLPLRAWRAAGRMLVRAGRRLAAAGRAGWAGVRAAVVARINATARAHPGRLLPPLRLARRLAPARALPRRGRGAADRPRPRLRRRRAALRADRRPVRPPAPPGRAALLRPPSPGPAPARHPAGPAPELRARGRGRGHGRRHRRLRPAAGAAAGRRASPGASASSASPTRRRPRPRAGRCCRRRRGAPTRPPTRPPPPPSTRSAPRRRSPRRRRAPAPRSGSTPTASSSATSTPCSPAGCCPRTSRSGGTRTATGAPWPSATSSRGTAPAAAVIAQAEGFAARARARRPRRLRHRHGLAPARRRGRRGALGGLVGGAGRRRPAPTTSRSTARSPRTPGSSGRRSCPRALGTAADNAFAARLARRPPRRRRAAPPARPLPVVFLSAAPLRALRLDLPARPPAQRHGRRGLPRLRRPLHRGRRQRAGRGGGADQGRDGDASTPEAIAALGRRNVATIGCWDDIRPDPEKARAVDAHMTLSHRQTLDLNRLFPETPAFLVTHHVNRQVPALDAARRPAAHRLLRRPRQHRAAGLGGGDDRPRRHRHPQRQRQLARPPCPATTATGSCAAAGPGTAGSPSSRASSPPAAAPRSS